MSGLRVLEYWKNNKKLYYAAQLAHEMGISLDALYLALDEIALMDSASENGNLSHLPSTKKSNVTS